MEDVELAGLCLASDQALCGLYCFPPIIKSVLLHKQKAWNESRAVHVYTETHRCKEISSLTEQKFEGDCYIK